MHSGGKTNFFEAILPTFTAGFGAGKTAMTKEMEPYANAAVKANFELFSLMSKRARAYMELSASMAGCRTPQDVMNKQQAFWQQCANDYSHAAQVAGAFWQVAQPVTVTGVEETLEDESLQSCPECGQDIRDVMTFGETRDTRTGRVKDANSGRRDAHQPAA